jgi:hypothetical protein
MDARSSFIFIEDFKRSEEGKMTWLDKVIMNYPKVRPTSFIADATQELQLGNEEVIRPSVWNRIILTLFFFFAGIFWITLLSAVLQYRSPFLGDLIAFLFITVIILLHLRKSFFSKRYNYTITVDHLGISIDNKQIFWSDVAETCIMSRHEGRRTNYYLLIFKKDATLQKCDLYQFGLSDIKLATIIEYYRAGVQ